MRKILFKKKNNLYGKNLHIWLPSLIYMQRKERQRFRKQSSSINNHKRNISDIGELVGIGTQ